MKTISLTVANDIIGGGLNPINSAIKGAQTGYDAGGKIMGSVGGVIGTFAGAAMGFIGGLFGTIK